MFDPAEDGIGCVGLGFVLKVDARVQPDVDAPCHEPCGDVRSLHTPVGVGNRTWFHGLEGEFAGVHITRGAAPSGEIRIRCAARVIGRWKQACRVGLPDFDHRIPQGRARAVKNRAFDGDLGALNGTSFHRCAKVAAVDVDARKIGRAADVDVGSSGLAWAFA